MTESIVADFTAEVELSNWATETPSQMRVVMSEDQLVFATDEAKQRVALTDVFDIAQDVSPVAPDESTETVSLAFRVGEIREVAAISASVETLVRFQQVLFKQLLNGTSVALKHKDERNETMSSPSRLSLRVTSSQIRFESRGEGTETAIVLPRDAIAEFKTANDSFGGDQQQPVMTLYSVTDRHPGKTVVCLPSFRVLNLFGRYLQAALTMDTADERQDHQGPVELLLVDDDPDDLEMAELFLRQQSDEFEITTATSAAGGLKVLAGETTVDCVVSDFDMPGTDGLEFLHEVRERYPDLPFILYTGQGSEAVAKQAILDDVTDYVEKDVGTEQYAVLAERIWKAVQ